MIEKYIHGCIYPLDGVLETNQAGVRYLLCGDGKRNCVINFGRRRIFSVPEECYTVIFYDNDYKLEKILFDEKGEYNYLEGLDKQGIAYSIPKKLPESHRREYSRLWVALKATCWDRDRRAYLGRNGYAITDIGYIGDDKYTSFEIQLCKNVESLQIGGHIITGISGHEIPNDGFIKRILTEEICVEEGEPALMLMKEAGLEKDIEHLKIYTEET